MNENLLLHHCFVPVTVTSSLKNIGKKFKKLELGVRIIFRRRTIAWNGWWIDRVC